jgi:hypothetical protein
LAIKIHTNEHSFSHLTTARAYRWSDDLVSGRVRSIGEIAKREHLTGRHVRRVMRLAFLAPRIVEAIAEAHRRRSRMRCRQPSSR